MMPINKNHLIQNLENLDRKLLSVWIEEDLDLDDDSRWELFVILLESRVELLKTMKDAGLQLTNDICLPQWLIRMANNRKDVRLRELKQIRENLNHSKKIRLFEVHLDNQSEMES